MRLFKLQPEAKFICLQILDGLEHMHSKNILHRDLKLENILIQGHQDLEGSKLYEATGSEVSLLKTRYWARLTRIRFRGISCSKKGWCYLFKLSQVGSDLI